MWKCLGWHAGFFISSVYLVIILALNIMILDAAIQGVVPNIILTGVAFGMEIPLYFIIGVGANRYFDKNAMAALNDMEKGSNTDNPRHIRRSRRSRRHRI